MTIGEKNKRTSPSKARRLPNRSTGSDGAVDRAISGDTAAPKRTMPPSGRQEVVAAIVASARTLFAERGPASVTLREIAQDAGVNFGLVYQYVGTKEELISEVLRRTAADSAARLADVNDFDEALCLLMSLGNGTTARILAWAVLEGRDVGALCGLSPALEVLTERARSDGGRAMSDDDAALVAAIAMVLATGWRLFGSTALAAAGLDATKQNQYGDRLARAVRLLAHNTILTEATRPSGRRMAGNKP